MTRMQAFLPAPLLRSVQHLSVSDQGTQRLIKSSEDNVNVLQQIAVWGLLRRSIDDVNGRSFDQYLPGGIERIGVFIVVCKDAVKDEKELKVLAVQAFEDDKDNDEIVLVYEVKTQMLRMFQCKNGNAATVEIEVVQCLHAQGFHRAIGFALVRCAVDLHVFGEKSVLLHELERYKAATRDVENFYVRARINHSKKGQRFCVLNGRGEDAMSTDAKPMLLKSILPECDARKDAGEIKRKKTNGKKQKNDKMKTPFRQEVKKDEKMGILPSLEYGDIATIDLLVSLGPVEDSAVVVAPVVTIPTSSACPIHRFSVYCDALVVVPVDSFVVTMLALLRNQLHHQLLEISNQLEDAPKAVSCLSMHQFPLVGAAFPLTVVASSTKPDFSSDDSMEDAKSFESLHRAFLQPMNQSLFRLSRGCSLAQQGEWLASSDVLYNVHEGIPSSGTGSKCESALVSGFYGYYHYLQQGVNDKGWGCAYRSLQTLASWLFIQHYTQQRFLLHEQIQSALVKIGDKPASFYGSTEWIGSLEVGYVLDELFGVPFRSLSVSSSSQLPDVARELLYHFRTQGTPVMMGGGQLAFTLLGVDYDPDGGVCAFLILDPHYTGDEDLVTIQNKTMMLENYKAVPCSWRKTTTFAKNCFYNFCLPQRPSVGI
ncbi:unnamed protein product [Peronospora belbahrii]|uniref:UFSP1/2/DUB catalytic domain-containing protein n=1 Tax=Peronospora belbahrii TaxID=622444 RepID=A0ABN8D8N9_9STRA|nr:unnamed protein product [Peronospora belbahrii]